MFALRFLSAVASLPILILAAPAGAAGPAADDAVLATPATIRDFMIQNVCLDAAGAVAFGRSPVDDGAACDAQRDLAPGERLPYHKHDHAPPSSQAGAPSGYQRHDSFPVATAGLGTVVEH